MTIPFLQCNNSDHPNTPLFQEKLNNYCIPSIQTPTFQIIILISKHLHLAELERVAEYLIAFDSFFGATVELPNVFQHTTGVFERLLDYYSCLRISTRLLLSLWSSNGGCQMCISLRRSLRSSNGGCQTCTCLRQSLRSSNGDCQMCIA